MDGQGKPWWKFLPRMFAFGLMILLCLQLSGRLLRPQSNRRQTDLAAGGIYGETQNTIDVLLMGDSNVAYAVAPMEWYDHAGITGYTYGVGWFTVFRCYYRLQRIYETQSPKVVILETDTLYGKKSRESYVSNAVWDVLSEVLPVLRYHDNWKSISVNGLMTPPENDWRSVNRGLWPASGIAPYTGGNYMSGNATQAFPFGVEFYLDRVRTLCEEHGSTLLLLSVPSATSWSTAKHNAVAAYAELHHLTYLDYNADPALNLDWSADTGDRGEHMNLYGAEKVTAALQRELSSLGCLPDHRGQPGYEEWDSDCAKYRADIDGVLAEMNAQHR